MPLFRLVFVFLALGSCAASLGDKNLVRIKDVLLSSASNLQEASTNAAGLAALGVVVPEKWCSYLESLKAFEGAQFEAAAALANELPDCKGVPKFDQHMSKEDSHARVLAVLGANLKFSAKELRADANVSNNIQSLREQLQALYEHTMAAKLSPSPEILAAVAVATSILADNQVFLPLELRGPSKSLPAQASSLHFTLHNLLGAPVCTRVQLQVVRAEEHGGASLDTQSFSVEHQPDCTYTLRTSPLEPGRYSFHLRINQSAPYYSASDLTFAVTIAAPARVTRAELVAHNAVAAKSSLRYSIVPSTQFDANINLEDGSSVVLTVHFEWPLERTAELALLRLTHNATRRFVDFVGVPTAGGFTFTAKINAAVFESQSGSYDLNVLLSDALMLAPVNWKAAQVHISFRTPSEQPITCPDFLHAMSFTEKTSSADPLSLSSLLPLLSTAPVVVLAFLLTTATPGRSVTVGAVAKALLLTLIAYAALYAWTTLPLLDALVFLLLASVPVFIAP